MKYDVYFSEDAERDLDEIHDYVAEHDSLEKAGHLFERIKKACSDLSAMPERGTYPKELTIFGIRDYREVIFKPYRIIYEVEKQKVVIYLIADGRRDMKTLLLNRLFGP